LGTCASSDKQKKQLRFNSALSCLLSECALKVFSRRNPSKLNTRVRFSSPAPIPFFLQNQWFKGIPAPAFCVFWRASYNYRTNQTNFSTLKRSELELTALCRELRAGRAKAAPPKARQEGTHLSNAYAVVVGIES
jgi:hypothetical protein